MDTLTRHDVFHNGTSLCRKIDEEVFAITDRANRVYNETKSARGRIADLALGLKETTGKTTTGYVHEDLPRAHSAPSAGLSKNERAKLKKNFSFKAVGTNAECLKDAVFPGTRKVRFEDEENGGEDEDEIEEESVNSAGIPETIDNTRIVFGSDGEERVIKNNVSRGQQTVDNPVYHAVDANIEGEEVHKYEAQSDTSSSSSDSSSSNSVSSYSQAESNESTKPQPEPDIVTVEYDDYDDTEEFNRRLAAKRAAREARLDREDAKANGTARGKKRKHDRRSLDGYGTVGITHRPKKQRAAMRHDQVLGGSMGQNTKMAGAKVTSKQYDLFVGRGMENKRAAEQMMANDMEFLDRIKFHIESSRRKLEPRSLVADASRTIGTTGRGKSKAKLNVSGEAMSMADAKGKKRKLSQSVLPHDIGEQDSKKVEKRAKKSCSPEKRKLMQVSGNENAGTAVAAASTNGGEESSKRRKTTPVTDE